MLFSPVCFYISCIGLFLLPALHLNTSLLHLVLGFEHEQWPHISFEINHNCMDTIAGELTYPTNTYTMLIRLSSNDVCIYGDIH